MSPTPLLVWLNIDEVHQTVPIGFTLLCATMLIFITPLWRTLGASVCLVATFLTTHTGLYRLWVDMSGNRWKSPSFEQTAAAMTERWKAKVRLERWRAILRSATPDALETRWDDEPEGRDRVRNYNYFGMRGALDPNPEKGKGRATGSIA